MDALRKMKEVIDAKKEEALMKVEEKKETLMKEKQDMEAKKEQAWNKVKEKKEALMKVKEDVEEKRIKAVRKEKEEVEAKKEEALNKVKEEVEEKQEALLNLLEDVEEKIEPVKMFFRGRMVDPISDINTTHIVPTLSTINAAVPPASSIEYDSDSSDSPKGSAESLSDEKANGKSRIRLSHRNGDTASLITSYPAVNSPPLNVVVHQSHGEQIFYPGVKYSGVQDSALDNHQSEDNVANNSLDGFSASPQKIQDQNGTYTSFEERSTSENRIVNLGKKISEEVTEIYLEKLCQQQESHEFYCPKCKTCITKVLIIRERYLEPAATFELPDKEDLRCSNCFAFLIPVGNWISNIFASKSPTVRGNTATLTPTTKPLPSTPVKSTGFEDPLLPHYSDDDLGDQIPREPHTVGHKVPEGTDSKHTIHHLGNNVPHDTISSISYPVSVNSFPVDIHQSHGEGIFYSGVKYPGVPESAVKKHQTGKDNIENKDLEDFSSPSTQKIQDQNRSYTYLEKGTTSVHGKVPYLGMKTAEGVSELYLEKLYQKHESHEFYCPNCNTCITKVLIAREGYYPELTPPAVILPDKEELRCTNCFSILVPAGNWIRNLCARINPTGQATLTPAPTPLPINPHYLDKTLGDQIPGNHQTVGQPSEHITSHEDNLSPGAVENINAEEATEIYLERLFPSPEPHEFYCPNCMSCITKVIIVRESDRKQKVILREIDSEPRPLPEFELRCTCCVSFLFAAGIWLMDIYRFTTASQIGKDPPSQTFDIVRHDLRYHGKEISYAEVLHPPFNSNKSLQDQNGNLHQKKSQRAFHCPSCCTGIRDVVKRSFIAGQKSEVKMCLQVGMKKMLQSLPFREKDVKWDRYFADASEDVHPRNRYVPS